MKPFREPPQLDPLSERSWQRIETNVFETLDSEYALGMIRPQDAAQPDTRKRSWRMPALLAAASLTGVCALVLVMRSAEDNPVVPHTSRIATGDSTSQFTAGDASLLVDPNSALLVTQRADGGVLTVLERGSASFAVAPRKSRPAFVVQAGDVQVSVIGTKFAVAREGDLARVSVTEGIVQVTHHGEVVRLKPGESWPTTVAELPDSGRLDSARSKRARKRDRNAKRRANRSQHADVAEPAKTESELDKDDAEIETAPTPSERYAAAARLEKSDPEAALAIYRELSKLGGAWGANALFARASLEAHRGEHAVATRLLRTYVERYPDGANISDARDLLTRLSSGND